MAYGLLILILIYYLGMFIHLIATMNYYNHKWRDIDG